MADGAAHFTEPGAIGDAAPRDDDDLALLVQRYEDAEDASREAREKAERDRDYVDNKQLTDEEIRVLKARGQPPIAFNLMRDRADFLSGMEKKQRRDPKAYPRNNPNDVQAAEAFTDGMRFVVERADYASKRSQAWKNIVIEGFGGVELAAVQKRDGWEFTISRIPWDRLFYDPHSSEPDFSDARYVGQVIWMDYDEALARAAAGGYVDEARAKEIIETTLNRVPKSSTYDDKPKDMLWGRRKDKRVRFVMLWERKPSGWCYYEFTQGGVFLKREAPYVDQDGESYCPWIIESANVDRDNNRYGEMRHFIDPQDEVNKRRSKALHLLNTTGVIAEEGAVTDVNKARRELAKPDFWLTVTPNRKVEIVKGADLAAGQAQLGAQAADYIQNAGPNGAMMGQGVSDQSGRAIEAQQAGGMIGQGDLMDVLRRFDWRVFNMIASMMKQFWDAQIWIRVTDDEDTPKFVGLNEPMLTEVESGETRPESEWKKLIEAEQNGQADPNAPPIGQLIEATDPETGEPLRNNDVARLDIDILVSDAPDAITLDGENYQDFTQLLSMGLPPPVLKLAIEMHPGLSAKRKKQLTEFMDEMNKPQDKPPEQADAERLSREMMEAKIADTRAGAYVKLTTGEERMARIGGSMPLPDVGEGLTDQAPQGPPQPEGGPLGPEAGPAGPMPPPGRSPPPAPPQSMPAPQGGLGELMMG